MANNKTQLTTEIFIEKSNKVHNNFYDYSESVYENARSKIKIICPDHGPFQKVAKVHMDGKGKCDKCSINKQSSKSETQKNTYIEKCNKIHNNKYDYSKVIYTNCDAKVEIICPSHGSFFQSMAHHVKGNRCPKCFINEKNTIQNAESMKRFLISAREIHGDKFTYDESSFTTLNKNMKIKCNKHDFYFEQKPSSHLASKYCCDICKNEGLQMANKKNKVNA